MTKQVIGLNGKKETVPFTTPCRAGKNGELPHLYTAEEWSAIEAQQAIDKIASDAKKADYEANYKYKDDRRKAYGTWEEQMERLYWDQVNGTSTFKDHQDLVRSTIPKPTGE